MGMTGKCSLEVITSSEALSDARLLNAWEHLVDGSDTPYGMYASPPWILHVLETSGAPVHVWKILDTAGGLQGFVPFGMGSHRLSFEAGNRTFFRARLRAAHVPGGVPALPKDRESHLRFFDGVFAGFPECECLHFDMVPRDHWFSDLLREDRELRKRYVIHSPFGVRKWQLLRIHGSFEDYLGRLGSKSRYNLRKSVRKMEDLGKPLRLEGVERSDQVPRFLEMAVGVSRNSWQHQKLGPRISDSDAARRKMADLVDRGLLRAYLLFSGEEPLAFSVAHQYRGVVNSQEMGYHQDFAQYSPGKVLLYLIIQDLHADGSVTLLNFGMGDAEYKRWFADIERTESSWLLMRRSLRNRLLTRSHAAFDGAVELAKRIARR
jgi:hypothetical protein